jgi:hypothetical protein
MYESLSFLICTHTKSEMKLNWFRDVKNLLSKYELADLLDISEDLSVPVNLLMVKQRFWKRLEEAAANLVQTDIIKMQNSVKSPLYQLIRTYCKQDPIMNTNTQWKYIILYVQIKSGIPRISLKGEAINLNAMNSYFNPFCSSDLDNCNLCSLKAPETLYHFLFECQAYTDIRQKFFLLSELPKSHQELFQMLASACPNYLKRLYLYIEKSVDMRKEWFLTFT